MDFRTRSYQKELLDQDNIPFPDIRVNMEELNIINTFLGGHRITCKGIQQFIQKQPSTQPLTIAETGCGGGDNLVAVHTFLNKQKRAASLIGIDIKDECIQYARQQVPVSTTLICSDYRKTLWPGNKPDIIFSSLFCHHFTDEELIEQLRWLKENSRLGFFINDLHRHPVAYYTIRLLTKLFSASYLVKNDAPLSVARSFKKEDWVRLMQAAGITRYSIKWQWAFRYLVIVDHE